MLRHTVMGFSAALHYLWSAGTAGAVTEGS
jgi:hypothetical protein